MAPTRILRDRVAGQSAMFQVVAAQRLSTPRSKFARFFGITPLTREALRLYRGALGELLVGDVLGNLGQRWDVLHDLPVQNGSLDHLVIGPAGVFTVRVVNCNNLDVVVQDDVISVAGESQPDVHEARVEAAEVARILTSAAGRPIAVHPLLVLVRPRRLTIKAAVDDVRIIPSSDLESVLITSPQALSGDEVAFISDIADLDTTWPTAGAASADTQKLHRDFSVIRAQVRAALVRRVIWATAVTTFLYISVCVTIAILVSIIIR